MSTTSSSSSSSSGVLAERLEAKMYSVFVRRCAAQQWLRGCVVLASFAAQQQRQQQPHDVATSTAALSASTTTTTTSLHYAGEATAAEALNVVDVARWNAYWEAYSEAYGDRIADLAQHLRSENACHAGDGHDSANAAPAQAADGAPTPLPAYRRLLLRVAYADDDAVVAVTASATTATTTTQQPRQHDNNDDATAMTRAAVQRMLTARLLHAATHFGAIEHAQWLSPRVWSVQFTTCAAAALFQQWLHGQPLGALLLHDSGDDISSACNCHTYVGKDTQRISEAVVRASLAPHDPHSATPRLLLGRHVRLSTPFADSLFCGVFDATAVCYDRDADALVVHFASRDAARVALHALQHSLDVVFGLSLTFA